MRLTCQRGALLSAAVILHLTMHGAGHVVQVNAVRLRRIMVGGQRRTAGCITLHGGAAPTRSAKALSVGPAACAIVDDRTATCQSTSARPPQQ